MAQLSAEHLEIPDRIGVGGDDPQYLPAAQAGQRLLGLENRQRAVQPGGVQFGVDSGHGRFRHEEGKIREERDMVIQTRTTRWRKSRNP